MSRIFGPVPSRRLGLSLGVDLVPLKICTFDCIYCQVGRTTRKTIDCAPFFPVFQISQEVEERLGTTSPDVITLTGSGEPTLHSEMDRVIDRIREISDIRIALLTNGSLLWRKEIRQRAMKADIILPTLCTGFKATFKLIHRPHPQLDFDRVIEGLALLREDYPGEMLLEVMVIGGINDTREELDVLKSSIDVISPHRIQINTVVRPPTDSDSRGAEVDGRKLEEVKALLGPRAEIVTENRVPWSGGEQDVNLEALMDMVRRRPLRAGDAAKALGISAKDAEAFLRGLLIKGYVRREEYSKEVYYLISEE